MAIWQFNLQLIPRAAILKKYNKLPSVLDVEEALSTAWWIDLGLTVQNLSLENFGPNDYNIPGLKGFGYADRDNITVCVNEENRLIEEIGCRLDLRELDEVFINRLIELARNFDCLIMDRKGNLFNPTLGEIRRAIKASNSFRFVSDPEKFLSDLSDGFIQQE